MKNAIKFLLLTCSTILIVKSSHSQNNMDWLSVWQNPSSNFFTIKHTFDSTWSETEREMRLNRGGAVVAREENESEQDGSFTLFKRWEWYYAPRVGASGDLSLPAYSYINFFTYLEQNENARQMHQASINREASTSNWTFVGPTGAPNGGGAGRINFIRIDPTNGNVMYAGAPAGGLWKSVNGGSSWTCLTDFLPIIGCSDLAIDPTNSNILYLATGDLDGGDTPTLGVMKSIDGGITWTNTGLNFNLAQNKRIARIIIDPTNTNVIYCGTTGGIFKTYDAGVNWTQMSASGVQDMEMKPGDPNTLYACKTSLIKTTNGGATWTSTSAGLPQNNQVSRLAIAVTANDPNYVYVLAGSAGSQGFQGLYRSVDGAISFTSQASSPNLLGWDENGGDTDGQAWYDLSVQVAPYDKDLVIVGGVNVWRSDDGGVNWNIDAHWYGAGGNPYVHADVHGLEFLPGVAGTYFVACDGGVFTTTDDGGSFSDLSSNMCIAQIYKLGASTSNAGTILTGHQDNGTNRKVGATYDEVLGGDGMDCFIDASNDNNMFGSIYYGDFYKSINGGNSFSGITNGLSGNAAWVSPWKQDPSVSNTLYCGYDQVFISTNLGNSWTQLGTLPNSSSLTEIEIAPTNSQYIYTTNASSIYRTINGGTTWTNITGSLLTNGAEITGITISPFDENVIWISFSGYMSNNKAYYSNDAGDNWINISYGLPNIPANAIEAVPQTGNNLVFIGMDAGVYYRSDNSNGWQPYFSALPLAPISDFEIFEPTMTLRASTYGRGVWECSIDAALITPLAAFTANTTTVCPGQPIQLTDATLNNPTSWSWSFPGGNPSTSTIQNPIVTYALPGTYAVTLSAANSNGGDIESRSSYITVSGAQLPPLIEGFTSSTFLPTNWRESNTANTAMYWEHSATIGHNSTSCAYFNNFSNNANGDIDDMITPGMNLSGYGTPLLQFDVAYARYNASRSDTLEVLVSDDCGATWTSVYMQGGSTLSTVPDQLNSFAPTNSQWRMESVNLNAYSNVASLTIAFRNHGRHGNNLYLDNINLTATPIAAPTALFSSATICQQDSARFTDLSSPLPTNWAWTFSGGNPSTSTLQNPAVIWTATGTQTVTLIATNAFGADTIVQTVTVNTLPIISAGSDTSFCGATYASLDGSGGLFYSWAPTNAMYSPSFENPNVNVTSSTTYTLTATDNIGCSNTDTVHITINPLPTFAATPSDGNICPGDTISIVCSNNQLTYSWTPGSSLNTTTGDTVLAFPNYNITYTIIGTNTTTGCATTVLRPISVYAYLPQPTVLIWGFTLTCSTPASSYQWYLNGTPIAGATQQSYIATQVGMYQVEAFNAQGCSAGISSAMLVDAIPDVAITAFSVYPNPNIGVFSISFSGEVGSDYFIEVLSADGRVVQQENVDNFNGQYQHEFDLTQYGSGAYVIRITHNNVSTAYRMIVY